MQLPRRRTITQTVRYVHQVGGARHPEGGMRAKTSGGEGEDYDGRISMIEMQTSKQNGSVGGYMVKKMIEQQEKQMLINK